MLIEVDILLLDIEMPIMNGLDTLLEIKKLYPELRVIMYSGKSDLRVIEQFLKLGANDFVCKMCDFKKLVEAINKQYDLIQHKRAFSFGNEKIHMESEYLCFCLNA